MSEHTSEHTENNLKKKKLELSPSVSIIIAGVIIAAAIIFTNHKQPTTLADANAAAANAGVPTPTKLDIRKPSKLEHIVGSADAPIALVEYSDFQCPFCTMIYPTLKKIVSSSNGNISWVMRELPLTSIHPQAEPAAHAASCIAGLAGNDAYWKYADTVFANQSKLTPEYSAQIAASLGIDPAKFASCVSNKQYQSSIDSDTNEAMANGGNGTPFTIVMNTKTGKMIPISGALPQAQIEQAIAAVQ